MVVGTLAKIGVQAVVEGLPEFGKAFNKMNSLLSSFGKNAETSTRKMSPFSKVLDAVGESLRRIGEFVIAGLIVKGIEKITSAIANMAREAFNAAAEFQGLVVRLENFIAADILAAGGATNIGDALMQAAPLAEDLFFWVQKLALVTPFDIQDVADAFTMAKAWGFGTEEAKKLTKQVIDFTAGMGLEGEAMDRVIKALGQMKSLGRVAGQELLQLANAGVPVADIMENIRKSLGLTTDEFEKLRMKGGISADIFFAEWEKLVNTRFMGSAERMSRTIGGVLGNLKDLVQGLLGFNVVRPVLDVISEKIATFIDALTTGVRGDKIIAVTKAIGDNLAGIVEVFIGKLPGAEGMADKLLEFLDKISGKILGIRTILESEAGGTEKAAGILALLGLDPGIAGKVEEIFNRIKAVFEGFKTGGLLGGLEAAGAPEGLLGFIERIMAVFDRFGAFWDENGERITGAFGKILGGFGEGAGGIGIALLDGIVTVLEKLADFLEENGDKIVTWLENIGNSFETEFLPAFQTVADFITENKEEILTFIANFVTGLLLLKAILLIFSIGLKIVVGIITLLIIGLIAIIGTVVNSFNDFGEFLATKAKQFAAKIKYLGNKFIVGLREGISEKWQTFKNWLNERLSEIPQAIKDFFGIGSPSKMFAGFGENLMEGFAKGIQDAIQLPQGAMQMAVTHTIAPVASAVQASPAAGTMITNNFNQTVNTQASASTVIPDFRSLQSMVGV